MNFLLTISGYRFDVYDECVKFILTGASNSDYVTKLTAFGKLSPMCANYHELFLKGSSKNKYKKIAVDFDNVLSCDSETIVLSPETLGINPMPDCLHYWSVIGALFKVVGDISTAYVTGYLLEKNMKKELEAFNKFSSQLPFSVQVAFNEIMIDKD